MKKLILLIFAVFVVYGLGSCEKAYIGEEVDGPDEKEEEREDHGGWYDDDHEEGDTVETGFSTGDVVDVATFRTQPIYVQVWVKGYIVGAATGKNHKYRYEFGPGFTFDTALLLADRPDADSEDEVISVCLTNCSERIRKELNLKDNPSNKGKLLAVFGVQEKYLKLWGIKHIDAYDFPAGD